LMEAKRLLANRMRRDCIRRELNVPPPIKSWKEESHPNHRIAECRTRISDAEHKYEYREKPGKPEILVYQAEKANPQPDYLHEEPKGSEQKRGRGFLHRIIDGGYHWCQG
jgi:hypothetical protein